MHSHAPVIPGSLSERLAGNPNMRDTLKVAALLGCGIRPRAGTGEVIIAFPGIAKRFTASIHRKDTPWQLLKILRRMAGQIEEESNGATDPEPEPITPTAAADEGEPETLELEAAAPTNGGPSLPPQFVSREEVILRCNSDAIYKPTTVPEEIMSAQPLASTNGNHAQPRSLPELIKARLIELKMNPSQATRRWPLLNRNMFSRVVKDGSQPTDKTIPSWADFLGISADAVKAAIGPRKPYGWEAHRLKLTEPTAPTAPAPAPIAAPAAPAPKKSEAAAKAGDIAALMSLAQSILDDDLATTVHAADARKRAIIQALLPLL